MLLVHIVVAVLAVMSISSDLQNNVITLISFVFVSHLIEFSQQPHQMVNILGPQ